MITVNWELIFYLRTQTSNLSKAHETRESLSMSCSQVVLVCLQPFLCNTLYVCLAAKNRKNTKTLYFGGSRSFKVIDVDTIKRHVTSARYDKQHVCSICKRFHASQANTGKITFFKEYPSLTPMYAALLEPRGLQLAAIKSKLNAENFVRRLTLSIFSHFGAIYSLNVCHSRKS